MMKKNEISIQLKSGIELTLTRDEMHLLGKVKEALEYGISIRFTEQTMYLSAYPVLDLTMGVSSFKGIELLNVISIVLDCVKFGIEVKVVNGYDKNEGDQNRIYIDPLHKIIISQSGIKFYMDSIMPGLFKMTFIQEKYGKIGANFSDMKVLDVGANFGDSSLYFARNGAKVYAIEPVKANFEALKKNVSLNNEFNLELFNLAIGPMGRLNINTKNSLDGAASGLYSTGGMLKETVNSVPISLFLKSNGLEYIDLLKMACMGCEKYLTIDDLLLVKKFVHIEFDPKSEVSDIHRFISLLESSGFAIKVLNHNIEAGIGKGRNFGTIYAARKEI